MTRKRLYDNIRAELEESDIKLNDGVKSAVDTAVCCTLETLLEYGQQVALEMTAKEMYSEAMTAGLFVTKIKALMNGK